MRPLPMRRRRRISLSRSYADDGFVMTYQPLTATMALDRMPCACDVQGGGTWKFEARSRHQPSKWDVPSEQSPVG